ncbi:S-layer homology domain-containing protein [Paenibacillaceae bacterium WGS1546]|uniref:S-layer homology domain-containing protein n=1 Tax=Cohnella sp. WGS1546 TaxID=3366810 RepID=UPI00372D6623
MRTRKQRMYAVLLCIILLAGLLPGYTGSVHAAPPVKAVKIAAGDNFSLALKSDGSVVGWGVNTYLQLNVPHMAQSGVIDIAAGANHALALLSTGRVVAWGANTSGQSTVPIEAQNGVIAIAAGEAHSLALKDDGSVLAWGLNDSGQTIIPSEARAGVTAIAAGRKHSLALRNGGVIAWGRNDEEAVTVPVAAQSGIVSLAATNWHSSAAVASDGRVLFWGLDHAGMGTIPEAAQSGVTSVSLASSHVVAVKDGGVIAWGSSSGGKTSVPVAAQSGVIAVAAGDAHSLALKTDGTVVAWGNNLHGQSTVPGNADLSGLAITEGVTTSSFQSDVTNYTHYVGAAATSVDVTAVLSAPAYGALLINGEQQPSGTALTVPLTGESTAISVQTEPYLLAGATYSVTVLRDTTPPSVSFGTDGNESWATAASTTVTVADTESGLDDDSLTYAWSRSSETPNTGWTPFESGDTLSLDETDGDWYLHIRARDRVGNTANETTARFRLDNTPPSIEVTMTKADQSAYIDNTWTNQHVNVSANALDDSGITSFEYSRNDGATWDSYTPSTEVTLTEEDIHTLTFRAVNAVGLETSERRTVKISTSGLVLTPTLLHEDNSAYSSGAWTNASVTVSVYADAGTSGINSLTYSLNGGAAQPYTSETPILFDQEGAHTVFFEINDSAGNARDATLAVNLDRTTPSVSFGTDGNESWATAASTTVTVDDELSGPDDASLFYAWTTSTDTPDEGWSVFRNGDTLTLDGKDGEWYLHIRALDQAGNGANAVTHRFLLDTSTAELSALSISSGSLQPVFASGITAYEAQVNSNVSNVTVTPVTAKMTDTVTVSINNGMPVAVDSGQQSEPLALRIGANTIAVQVTSLNGAQRSYIVTVTRRSSGGGVASPPSNVYLVGPAGRSIRFDGGQIVIPQGALNTSLYLTISSVDDIGDGSLQDRERLVSRAIRLVADREAELLKQINVSLFLHNGTIEQERYHLSLYGFNDETSDWTEMNNITVNRDEGVISGTIDRFAAIAAISRPIEETEEEQQNPQPDVRLNDIAGHWAEAGIRQAVEKGIVAGYPDGSFRPNRTVTRAEFVVMLMRALKWQGEEDELAFVDSSKIPAWARQSLAQAVKAGIIRGYTDGRVNPTAEITRAEMAVMVAAAIGLPNEGNEPTGFADDRDIPVWAKTAIAYMKQSSIVQGDGANRFMPQDHAARAEAVTLLLNMLAHQGQ